MWVLAAPQGLLDGGLGRVAVGMGAARDRYTIPIIDAPAPACFDLAQGIGERRFFAHDTNSRYTHPNTRLRYGVPALQHGAQAPSQ